MRAAACTQCRQSKARCDFAEGAPGGCSRCRFLKVRCVFDASYRRVSTAKRMQQMTSEIHELRKALQDTSRPSNTIITTASSSERADEIELESAAPDARPQTAPGPSAKEMAEVSSAIQLPLPLESNLGANSIASSPALYHLEDTIHLTEGQVDEAFRRYFARYHPYLAFQLHSYSPQTIYSTCPLLFWVICAVTSSFKIQSLLSPIIKGFVAKMIHSPGLRTIETVQALLILSVWPFRVSFLADDPSHLYSSIASHISLELGLHRPTQTHSHRHRSERHTAVQNRVKSTTWMACFVVNYMKACNVGLPPSITSDASLTGVFDDPSVDLDLIQLCRIYTVIMDYDLEIGFHGPPPSGILEPTIRITKLKQYSERLAELRRRELARMSQHVFITFLYAKVRLGSFALLGDMTTMASANPELVRLVQDTEEDTYDLVELCYGINLSSAPAVVWKTLSYCGFVLIRILRTSLSRRVEVLEEKLERIRSALRGAASSQEDLLSKCAILLQTLPTLDDLAHSPPIVSRMGASVLYDSIRIFWENWHQMHAILDTDNTSFDLDGIDWSTLGFEELNA